jgi:hypothetical protein
MTEEDSDVERLFAAAIPQPAPAELRPAVIEAIAAELQVHAGNRRLAWQTRLGQAVAASVLVSTATFLGVSWSEARRMARWDERTVVRSYVVELTAAAASVTDDESARRVERYLLSRLQDGAQPTSTVTRKDLQEIQRWLEGQPLAERYQSNDTTQERI